MVKSRLTSFLNFVWLTLGYGVTHAVVVAWIFAIAQSFWGNDRRYENVVVIDDGEPLIQIQGRNVDQRYRKLDGTVVTDTLGLKTIYPTNITPDTPEEPNSWERRIASFLDFQIPETNWYLIAPPDYSGFAYFEGYEPKSCQLIGYLDVNGFSTQRPAIEKSFPIATQSYGFHGSVAQTVQIGYYNTPSEPPDVRDFVNMDFMTNAPIDGVWILSKGTLYEIRLGSRTVRTVIKDRPDMRNLAQAKATVDGKPSLQLLVRSDTGLLIIDPATEEYQTVLLDPLPPHASDSYCQLSNGKRLIVRNVDDRWTKHESIISWLDADGKVERREEVRFASNYFHDFATTLGNLGLCLLAPSPIVSCGTLLVVPFVLDEFEESSYVGRFLKFLSTHGLWVAITVLVGFFAGWASRRRELEVFGSASWFWPILVGACGGFGWIGYICLRPLPARLPEGEWMPTKPEPNRPFGTEIFA